MNTLNVDDGTLFLSGQRVAGIVAGMRIQGQVRFDSQRIDGLSGVHRTPQGWEDSTLMLFMILLTDDQSTCYEKLRAISRLFRSTDPFANPRIFTVSNPHIAARGIRQLVFSRLESSENEQFEEIHATLAFLEHIPPVVRIEVDQARTPAAQALQYVFDTLAPGVLSPDDFIE